MGSVQEQLDKEIAEHLRTIDVLRMLKAGTITLGQLTVTERGWVVSLDEPITQQELSERVASA